MEKKRINIAHIADKFGVGGSSIHGVTRLFSWWIPRFDKEIFNVYLAGLRKEDEAAQLLSEQGIKLISMNKGKFDLTTLNEIIRLIKSNKIDILHLHGYGATNFGRVAAKITKIRNIVHEHFA